jgi:hypothetical protein
MLSVNDNAFLKLQNKYSLLAFALIALEVLVFFIPYLSNFFIPLATTGLFLSIFSIAKKENRLLSLIALGVQVLIIFAYVAFVIFIINFFTEIVADIFKAL